MFLDSRFADDGANFSINTDDPMVTGTWTEQEYELLRSWGLKESHLVKSNINALKASFLPEDEKAELLSKLFEVLGFTSRSEPELDNMSCVI